MRNLREMSPLRRLMFLGSMANAAGKLIEDTVTGNPLVFTTDVAKPLKSLLIPFTPKQEGSGDPSPQNIRSIIPWNGLTVFGGGKNLLDVSKGGKGSGDWKMTFSEGKVTNAEIGSGASDYVIFSQDIKAGTYTISFDCTSNISPRFLCTAPFQGGNYNSYYKAYYKDGKQITFTITESASVGVVFSAPNHVGETGSIFDIQLEFGSSASAYEPYITPTETDIVFSSPVYGGTLDMETGELTVEWVSLTINGSEPDWLAISTSWNTDNTGFAVPISVIKNTINSPIKYCDCLKPVSQFNDPAYSTICNDIYSSYNLRIRVAESMTVTELRAYLAEHPITVAYKLATPQTVQLTAEQITAIKGQNTLWSDADGSMMAVYLKKA